jgi:hypothetical protein
MKKIIFWAVVIVVLSQGVAFLNNIYPEGGFVASGRRDAVFALVPTRGDEVAAVLRAEVPACLEKAANGPISPLAAEMFAEVTGSLTTMPSAKTGKVPEDDEITAYQADHSADLVARFEPALLALTETEFAVFEKTQSVVDKDAVAIIQCIFDAAHSKLISG